jgi:putative nucleotidyltransferase with HDIG domain
MNRQRLAALYIWAVALVGCALWALTTLLQAPSDIKSGGPNLLIHLAILLVLTILSSVSPVRTKVGSIVTVGLAPLFGAFLLLPPWAVMTVAALGTLDQRIPGRGIPWDRFLMNRGMYVIQYGIPSLLFYGLGFVHHRDEWIIVLPLAVLMIVLLNVGQLSIGFSLVQDTSLALIARRMVSGHWATYLALPLLGYLIAVILDRGSIADQLVVFLLYGPLLVYRASLQKQSRLDQWLRDSYIMQSRVVDKRDGQTFGHSQRVGEMCEGVARLLHLSDDVCNTIRVGGILHDLGKIAIPDSILLKPGKLTPEEYEIIKTHPVEGAQILAEHPEQREVAEIVHHHHERWDGAGYPDGLKGEQIPIGSRIVNACDAFDTITQARVFRPTVKTPGEAIRELRQLAGTWYDPTVIGALEKIVAERWGIEIQSTPAAAAVEPHRYREILAVSPFRFLWIGQAVSYFGDMMNTTGLAILLFVVTHSPYLVALGLISKAVPTVLFGLVAGTFVDRFNRQRLMIISDLIRAMLTVTIPFVAMRWLPGVFIAVFLVATASAFFNPAKQALVPNLVSAKQLVQANGLIASSEKAMELLGYSIAGIIAAAISFVPLFLIDAATYLFSAATLLGVRDTSRATVRSQPRLLADIAEGARFILQNVTLRSSMALTLGAVVFSGLTYPILVMMSYGPFKSGAFGYGLLEAAIGAGALLGALLAPVAMRRFVAGGLILAGVAGMGLANFLAGFMQSVWLAAGVLLVGGIANTVYYVPLISVTQREAPDFIRGRVMATRFLLVQVGLLTGMALAGPLTDRVGAPVVYSASGFLLICAALSGALFRGLRNAALREEPVEAPLKAAG